MNEQLKTQSNVSNYFLYQHTAQNGRKDCLFFLMDVHRPRTNNSF